MRASSRALKCRAVLAGVLHSILMGCAFPPLGWWGLSLLAPVPLIWIAVVATRVSAAKPPAARWRRCARALAVPGLVALGVVPFWAWEQAWVLDVSNLGYAPMVLYLSLYPALFVALLTRTRRRWPSLPLAVAAPVLWTAVEVLRGEVVFTGYPWFLVGHPLIDAPILACAGTLLGACFVTFLVVAVGGAACELLSWHLGETGPRAWRAALGAVGLVALAWMVGFLLAPVAPGRGGQMRIAVVQTNVPQDNKIEWTTPQRLEAFDRFAALTREAAAASPRPDLIVWPETMFPGLALDDWLAARFEARAASGELDPKYAGLVPLYSRLLVLQAKIGIPMLVGSTGYDLRKGDPPQLVPLNSAFLVRAGQVQPPRYDKIELTPFGEVMPYINLWPWLQQKLLDLGAHGMTFELSAGRSARVFEIESPGGPVILGTPICFEATKTGLCRRLIQAKPGVRHILVNLTNDGWFGAFDAGRAQHLQLARWRALELGVPVVRAANTGISCAIDGLGRVVATAGARADGVLIADIAPATPATIYSRVGRLFAWLVLAAGACLAVASFWRARPAASSRT